MSRARPPLTGELAPNQFGDPSLSTAEAYAACGPIAAVAFAKANGRNPTPREAVDLAARVGWDPSVGMHGPAAEVELIRQLGVPVHQEAGVDWAKVRADVQNGNPVAIDTPDHYFFVGGYNPQNGTFDFGATGTAIVGGNRWMTPAEMARISPRVDTTPRSTIYMDSPLPSTGPSVAGKYLASPLPEGGSVEEQPIDWTTQTAPLTKAQVDAVVAANGGRIVSNTPVKGTETVKDEFGDQVPNPNPTYHVVFANGKALQVKGERDAQGEATGNWLPVGGTALKPPSTAADKGFHIITQSDGSSAAFHTDGTPVINPQTGQQVTGSKGESASLVQERAAAAIAHVAAANLANVRAANVGQPTPLDPATRALREAETIKNQLEAAKAAQALVPVVTRAMRDFETNMNAIAAQYTAPGSVMTLEQFHQAQAAAESFRDAALKGTTPAEQEKQRQEQDAKRAQIGKDLLDTQMRTAAENAKSAGADYRELLTNQHVVIPEQYDPMQRAGLLTAGMTGELGKQPLSEFARALIEPLLSRTNGTAGGDYPGVTPAFLEHPDYPGVTPASLVGPEGEGPPPT